jgi:hypothetical protein
MELNASTIVTDTIEDGSLLWMVIFCIMGIFQATNKEPIVILKMDKIANKFSLNYFNKMLACVSQTIILTAYRIEELFATHYQELIIVESYTTLKIVLQLISLHALKGHG